MAAGGAATTTTHKKIQSQAAKPRRRKYREVTISSSAAAASTNIEPSSTASDICPPSESSPPPYAQNPVPISEPDLDSDSDTASRADSCLSTSQLHSQRYRHQKYSPSCSSSNVINNTRTTRTVVSSSVHFPQMEYSPTNNNGNITSSYPSSFSKFNSALTAGLLNPMSPPPHTPPQTPPPNPNPIDKTSAQSSPTLSEMMANESDCHPKAHSQYYTTPNGNVPFAKQQASGAHDKHYLMQHRISETLGSHSPGSQFNDPESSDIKVTLSSKDGFSVGMNVHRQILVAHSRFFAGRLTDRWVRQQRETAPFAVEIADCDDVEVYVETLRLMYCKDLRRRLMKEDVTKVLGILKVSAAIGFDAGVLSCLEYLEAAPWTEDEEIKVASLLSELRLEGFGANEVLKRVSLDVASTAEENSNDNEEVLMSLLQVVLEGKDEKAGREMKGLVSKMLRENANQSDLRKESLYTACEGCLQQLRHHLLRAAGSDLRDVAQIARQALNLHWLLDILIDRQIAEDFLKMWASETDMSSEHSKVPAVHRYEISRVTARLLIGIGKVQLLASKDARWMLLQTWLGPFYDDFGWMRRASKGLDRHSIENGLSNTILTLPLSRQQETFLAWFDRFLNSGEDCPNIQRGFEVWWRRAFWRRNSEPEWSRVTIVNPED